MKNSYKPADRSAESLERSPFTIGDMISAYKRTKNLAKLLIESGKISSDFWRLFNGHWTEMGKLHLKETGREKDDTWYADDIVPEETLGAFRMIRSWAMSVYPGFRATLSPLERHALGGHGKRSVKINRGKR